MEQAQSGTTTDQFITEEVAQRRRELFNQYVSPYLNMIYKLCINYTFNSSNLQDNYNEVLTNLYKYIETYDNSKSIRTWLHIVTKRCVLDLDLKRSKISNNNEDRDIECYADDVIMDDSESEKPLELSNYTELYNDDIISALKSLKPIYRDALLLQQAGYKLREIADIEHKRGNLKNYNIETIKSRLFLARGCLQELLTKDGKRRETK